MKKRVLGVLLSVVMAVGMLPGIAFAEGEATETTNISVVKQWSDTNHEADRPASITVNLLADGTKVDSLTMSADANGKWEGSFTSKPAKNSTGETISYTVEEETVTNYKASYTAPTPGSVTLDSWDQVDLSILDSQNYDDGYTSAIDFLLGKKDGNYYIWSKQVLDKAQESLVIDAVNSKAAFTDTLTTTNTTFASGSSASIPGVFSVEPADWGDGVFTMVSFDLTNLVDAAYDANLILTSGVDHWTITNTYSSEKPDPTVPTGLSGVKGNALSTVTLPDGWTWVDGTTVMNSEGSQTFKANYTDTTGTYNNLTNVDVTVKVVKVDTGSSYDHIDVKVDGKYSVNVDGTKYTIDGTLQSDTIKVTIGSTTYNFKQYRVNTQSEGNRKEYEIKTTISPSSITWGNIPYQMTNVVVSARMLFTNVPDDLKEILPTTTIDQTTYYYADITDMKYTGVQECTGGKGMRSEGNNGTPTGLDLYITAEGAGIYITKGKLAIQKDIVDEAGNVINDATEFTFTVKGNDMGSTYNQTVKVKGGSTVTLTDLPAGSYTVTEIQQAGYAIRSIDGEATTNYSKDYVIVAKEDTSIPVAEFTNTKLTEQSSVNIKKTASGLPEGTDYPNPTINIYAADAQGSKSGKALWSGTLTANGDILYLTPLFKNGTYVVEETGADVDGYSCTTALSVKENGVDMQSTGMTFTVSAAPKTYSLTVNNQYSTVKETIDIPVEKVWDDEGYEAERPDSITVNLLANGDKVGSMTLNAEDQWKGSFTDKPITDKDGKEIAYTVTEDVPENYTAKYTEPTADVVTVGTLRKQTDTSFSSDLDTLLVANKGSNYYIWTEQSLTGTQKSLVLNTVNNRKAFNATLTLENTTFVSGNAATVENVLTVEPASWHEGYRTFTISCDEVYIGVFSINDVGQWTITNTYDVPTPEPAWIMLIAKKTMDGGTPADSAFTFQLKDSTGKVMQTVKNDGNGMIPFELSFEEAGTYTYTMSEVTGANTGIAYDSTVYTVNIAVELNDDGNYDVTVDYLKDGKPYIQTDTDITIPVFANTTKPGTLVVSKTVSGDGADKTKAFPFTVTLTGNGNSMNGDVKYGDVTFTNGTATFTLKDGESKTLSNLPAGYTYLVEESDNADYTVTVNKTSDTKASGTILAGKTITAAFDNYKAGNTPTEDGGSSDDSSTPATPKTGDSSNIILWIGLACLSAIVLLAAAFGRKHAGRHNK